MSTLAVRTEDVCNQLMRYGEVCSSELLDVLDAITDINDDLQHGREDAPLHGAASVGTQGYAGDNNKGD